MFKKYYPWEYAQNIFSIDYEKLYKIGYRGLIFDIDNTLVHHGDDSNETIDVFFEKLHGLGFKTLLLSNNDETRIKRFNKNIGTLYISDSEKPKTHNYHKALEIMCVQKEQALFIGDQIFTDILGANKSGIANILVKFMQRDINEKIGIRRNVEKIILKFYRLNNKAQHRLGDIIYQSEQI